MNRNNTNSIIANAIAAKKSTTVACNWQRIDDYRDVSRALDILVGMNNSYKSGIYDDVDQAEKEAFKIIVSVIRDLRKVANVFRRERKEIYA